VCPDDGKSPIRVHNPPQMVTARSLMRSKKQEASLSDYFISLLACSSLQVVHFAQLLSAPSPCSHFPNAQL
jgi:hypothetical protein